MIASTYEKFALVDTTRGLTIRTANTLKDLLTELMMNSGEEIALWSEGEAKRCADKWRSNKIQEMVTEGKYELAKELLAWAEGRKSVETDLRPDVNVYKRTLVETWDQVIRKIKTITMGEADDEEI